MLENKHVLLVIIVLSTVLLLVNNSSANGFETQGAKGPTSFDLGLPIHQDITKQGLYFLKPDPLNVIVSQHVEIEQDPSSPNHFDNCQFSETVSRINERYSVAVTALNPHNTHLDVAERNFGYILHAAQDFYSHTNWVEMGRTDLVDPWLQNWRPLNGYTLTTNPNPVFVLEENGSPHADFQIYKNGKIITVVQERFNATSLQKLGLISGTYDADVSKCPQNASIPHGGAASTVEDRLANDESRDLPDELNKDHPARLGHQSARNLAVEQTTHEFCRLVEMTRQAYGEDGVKVIYDNWVQDQYKIDSPYNNARCSTPASTQTSMIQEQTTIKENNPQIPSWIKNNAKWWSDGTVSDKEFATAIGYLVQKKIISASVATNTDGTILVNDNLSIPTWIKNNAKWWSEGSISDKDFTSGIEYIVNQKIISFSEPTKQPTISKDDLKSLYLESKLYEKSAASLLVLNDNQDKVLQLLANAGNKNTNDPKTVANEKAFEFLMEKQSIDEKNIQQILDTTTDISNKIKDLAQKQGVSSSDLDKIIPAPSKNDNSASVSPANQLKQSADDAKINQAGANQQKDKINNGLSPDDIHMIGAVLGSNTPSSNPPSSNPQNQTPLTPEDIKNRIDEIQSLLDSGLVPDNAAQMLQIELAYLNQSLKPSDQNCDEKSEQHLLDLMQQCIDILQREQAGQQQETDSILSQIGDSGMGDSSPNVPNPTPTTPTTPPSPGTSLLAPNLQFTVPSQVIQEATSSSGAIVSFAASWSSPVSSNEASLTCDHLSGSTFPIGNTVVTCTATDLTSQKTIQKTFTVVVRDTTPPAIGPFQPVTGATDDSGAIVYFTISANDLVDGPVTPVCNHNSGDKFPIGVSTITCTAKDSRGNQSTRTLQITITKS